MDTKQALLFHDILSLDAETKLLHRDFAEYLNEFHVDYGAYWIEITKIFEFYNDLSNLEYIETKTLKNKIKDCLNHLISHYYNIDNAKMIYLISTYLISQTSDIQKLKNLQKSINHCNITMFENLDFRNELYKEINKKINNIRKAPKSQSMDTNSQKKKLFIVHGHNKLFLEEIKNFFLKNNYHPIVLNEKIAGGSYTLIEKLERNSENIGLVVVLFTSDDIGKKNTSNEQFSPRARQNVVFEMGYFMGKIGRDNVLVISDDESKAYFSDISGISYIPFENWKIRLTMELRAKNYIIEDLS